MLLCYGNRYAPDQFEAVISKDLSPCQMVAAGGIAAKVVNQHDKMNFATAITPIGILGNSNGKRINLADWALPQTSYIRRPLTIAVVGASMNSGKTTTAANLIRGLVIAGLKVGSAKVIGTGAGGDRWLMRDAGAEPVLDFTDVGFASTYKATPQETQKILNTLIAHIAVENVDVIVLEVADGLYQDETAKLLSSAAFCQQVDSVVLAVGSALGAMGGVEWLRRYQLPILGLSGVITESPLAMREAAKAISLAVFDMEMLRQQAAKLISSLSQPEILQLV